MRSVVIWPLPGWLALQLKSGAGSETVSGAVMCPGTQTTMSPLPTPTPDEPSASSSPAFA